MFSKVMIALSLFLLIRAWRIGHVVTVRNGTCQFDGERYNEGITYDEDLCKKFVCNITREGLRGGHLEINSCQNGTLEMPGEGVMCTYIVGRGLHPGCCNYTLVCHY